MFRVFGDVESLMHIVTLEPCFPERLAICFSSHAFPSGRETQGSSSDSKQARVQVLFRCVCDQDAEPTYWWRPRHTRERESDALPTVSEGSPSDPGRQQLAERALRLEMQVQSVVSEDLQEDRRSWHPHQGRCGRNNYEQ